MDGLQCEHSSFATACTIWSTMAAEHKEDAVTALSNLQRTELHEYCYVLWLHLLSGLWFGKQNINNKNDNV